MRKCILATTLLMVFLVVASAQKPLIKSIAHKQYKPNDDGELELSIQIEQTFNRFGNVTRQEYFYLGANNKLQSDRKKIFSYDSDGRHLNTLEYNGDNILESEIKIHWDEQDNKNKVEHITYSDGKKANIAVTYLLEYDQKGNKQNEKYFDENGNQNKGRIWYYNSQNEVIKAFTWSEKKNTPRKEVTINYTRDQNGDLIKSVSTEKVNNKVYRKDVRIFNNNYVIRWRKYISGKLESEFINEYRDSVIIRTTRRDKRKIISIDEEEMGVPGEDGTKPKIKKGQKEKRDGEEVWVTNSEYDVYGNIIITSQSINNKVVHVTQFVYDDYGNQVKITKTNKETMQKEEERLEYEDFGNVAVRILLKNDRVSSKDVYEYQYHER